MHRKSILLLLVLLLGLAGCNGNGDDPADEPADDGDDAAAGRGGDDRIAAVDYAFEDAPSTIAAGSQLTLDNQGDEPHEAVVFHIPDAGTSVLHACTWVAPKHAASSKRDADGPIGPGDRAVRPSNRRGASVRVA